MKMYSILIQIKFAEYSANNTVVQANETAVINITNFSIFVYIYVLYIYYTYCIYTV